MRPKLLSLVSVVIPTKNHCEDLLRPCLSSLIKYTDLSDTEVIVVANGCTDDTVAYVNSLGQPFKVVEFKDPLGYPKATNEGIKASKGDFIVFLNNDTEMLEQKRNEWIETLKEPFLKDPQVGISGPLMLPQMEIGVYFIVFFCAMVSRKLLDSVGLLSEEFSPGAGEDTDLAMKAIQNGFRLAQVPHGSPWTQSGSVNVGDFPIYHKGEATVLDFGRQQWDTIFMRNKGKLVAKYSGWKEGRQERLGNEFERPVVGRHDVVVGWEEKRMDWVRSRASGGVFLDLGCGSGYVLRQLCALNGYGVPVRNLKYLGVDYNKGIVEFARQQFGDVGQFMEDALSLSYCKKLQDSGIIYDTILAGEVIEHILEGRVIAQELKKSCKQLLITTPLNEPPGFWGKHHALHYLKPEDFPGFSVEYLSHSGVITSKSIMTPSLMLLESLQ